MKTLRRSSTGPEVVQLQTLLNAASPGLLKPDGLYGAKTELAVKQYQSAHHLTPDGLVGPQTWQSLKSSSVAPPTEAPVPATPLADPRSEKIIATLHPRLHLPARAFVHRAAAQGIHLKLISGHRTDAEQNALYAQGRTAPGPRVTNARAGYSNHNFGIAFDIGIFRGTAYLPESPLYLQAVPIAKALGFEAGADWTSFKDIPHYQLRPDWAKGMKEATMLAELRRRQAAGIDAFA